MKIEKLNENQIRCTLNKQDLINREIKISEFAYGSDKAKKLFRDMMLQASTEVGFEANDIPLVIEAIPVSSECIILIVTKVEDPEELDTRFSKFSPASFSLNDDSDEDSSEDSSDSPSGYHGAADILDLFKKISEELMSNSASSDESETPQASASEAGDAKDRAAVDISKTFIFQHLDEVCRYAELIQPFYRSSNTLYKDAKAGTFYLVITKGKSSPQVFNKICNIATEYGECVPTTSASVAYYNEHFTIMVKNKAIQKLANL
jgi:adapter protein MecA 1/2